MVIHSIDRLIELQSSAYRANKRKWLFYPAKHLAKIFAPKFNQHSIAARHQIYLKNYPPPKINSGDANFIELFCSYGSILTSQWL